MATINSVPWGKPDAGKSHVRFDEVEVASAQPRRGSLLYKNALVLAADGRAEVTLFALGEAEPAFGVLDDRQKGLLAVEYERPGTLAPAKARLLNPSRS